MGGWIHAVRLARDVEEAVLDVPDIEEKVQKAGPVVGEVVTQVTGSEMVGQGTSAMMQRAPKTAISAGTTAATGAAAIVGSVVLPVALIGVGLWKGAKALLGD